MVCDRIEPRWSFATIRKVRTVIGPLGDLGPPANNVLTLIEAYGVTH